MFTQMQGCIQNLRPWSGRVVLNFIMLLWHIYKMLCEKVHSNIGVFLKFENMGWVGVGIDLDDSAKLNSCVICVFYNR